MAMKLAPPETGFEIDAIDLGPLLELRPADIQRMMREGKITSRFERGEGEDAGRFRLTFFHSNRRVQLTIAGDGEVLKQTRVSWSSPAKA
jgi:Family of unknown function (DUF6522)